MSTILYSSKVHARAVALREAGWSYVRIAELLGEEFPYAPAWQTVRRWCNPAQRTQEEETRQRKKRLEFRRHGKLRAVRSDSWKNDTLRELYERGVPVKYLPTVVMTWWGDVMDEKEIRRRIKKGVRLDVDHIADHDAQSCATTGALASAAG